MTKTLIIGHENAKRLLPMAECIDIVEDLFRGLARGDTVFPLRQVISQPDRKGMFGATPAYLEGPRAVGGKFITVFNGNRDTPCESHQGGVLLFECNNGRLLQLWMRLPSRTSGPGLTHSRDAHDSDWTMRERDAKAA